MVKTMKMRAVYIGFFCLVCGLNVNAQQFIPGQKAEPELPIIPYGGAQYYMNIGEDRGLEINVQVWGCVEKPGAYYVSKTTDLVGLMSFAGGASKTANIKRIKIVRSNPKPEVITVNLTKYFSSPKPELIPLMKPGDVVIVPEGTYYRYVPILAQSLSIVSQAVMLWQVWITIKK